MTKASTTRLPDIGMCLRTRAVALFLGCCVLGAQGPCTVVAQDRKDNIAPLEQLKAAGARKSSYRTSLPYRTTLETPKADLKAFRKDVEPLLETACHDCHGSETAEGDLRVDLLDPDLLRGEDVKRWLDVSAALNNGEMPPEDGPELADDDRNKLVQWLATEIQKASQVRRRERDHSSFRRMTRYEYNYALQDLLGLPFRFAKDLPPDPISADGFHNSSELLQMSAQQYADYLNINRSALNRATVRGERPAMLYWGISAQRASAKKFAAQQERSERQREKAPRNKEPRQDPGAQNRRRGRRGSRGGKDTHYKNRSTGQTVPATWSFRLARDAWAPTSSRPDVPRPGQVIGVLPAGQQLVVDLGNRLPDEGTLRVRIRAWRGAPDAPAPSLALGFGWQGHNNSKASFRISSQDLVVDATPESPQFYQWDIPLSEIYPRNPVRKKVELGTPKMTNPSETIRLHNTSLARSADVEFDYIEVSAPVYEQWPPASHTAIFIDRDTDADDDTYARKILARFMRRAWRRNVTDSEVESKLNYLNRIRPDCEDFQEAVIETLATVLSSPRFLYLVQAERPQAKARQTLDQFELATRLAMFLWCSTPDDELIDLAAAGQLSNEGELVRQTKRMLADSRHHRFSKHFVGQWLNMRLLDYLTIDESTYPEFDSTLQEAMQAEPIAFFADVLENNRSVMDFIHADYALVNERLANHYGIGGVHGNHFRRVSLKPEDNRGGLLTQAGLLAMNSDGKDSHPLKRGIWLLESILNDPPPPPPPAVPEIDLADPEILKLSLKERMEDHRSKAACMSCHVKIDPWGIALENFDAVGSWRTQSGGKDIDASSLLFNQHELDGMEGLKRYLLANRQDQLARAMVHKLATFALGRPLSFADRADVERITAKLRREGDGLQTLLLLLVKSDLFRET